MITGSQETGGAHTNACIMSAESWPVVTNTHIAWSCMDEEARLHGTVTFVEVCYSRMFGLQGIGEVNFMGTRNTRKKHTVWLVSIRKFLFLMFVFVSSPPLTQSEKPSHFLSLNLPPLLCRNERVWFQLGSQGCVRVLSLSLRLARSLYIHSTCLSVSLSHPLVQDSGLVGRLFFLLLFSLHFHGHSFLVFLSVSLLQLDGGSVACNKPQPFGHPYTPHIKEIQPKGNEVRSAY